MSGCGCGDDPGPQGKSTIPEPSELPQEVFDLIARFSNLDPRKPRVLTIFDRNGVPNLFHAPGVGIQRVRSPVVGETRPETGRTEPENSETGGPELGAAPAAGLAAPPVMALAARREGGGSCEVGACGADCPDGARPDPRWRRYTLTHQGSGDNATYCIDDCPD
jgi:hypothetical protein